MLAAHAALVRALVTEGVDVTVVAPGTAAEIATFVGPDVPSVPLPRAPDLVEAAGWLSLLAAGWLERQPTVVHLVATTRLARTIGAARIARVPVVVATMLEGPPGLARVVQRATSATARYVPALDVHQAPRTDWRGRLATAARTQYARLRDLPWDGVETVFTLGEETAHAWRVAGLPDGQHTPLPAGLGYNLEAWLEDPPEPQIRRLRRSLDGEARATVLTWITAADLARLGERAILAALETQAASFRQAGVAATVWIAGLDAQQPLPGAAVHVPLGTSVSVLLRAADVVTVPFADGQPTESAVAAGTSRRVVCAVDSRGARMTIKAGRTGSIVSSADALGSAVAGWLADPMERLAAGSRARAIAVHGLDADLAIAKIVRAYEAALHGDAEELSVGTGGLERRARPGPRELLGSRQR